MQCSQTKLLLRVRQASDVRRAARLPEYRLIVRGIVAGQRLTDAGRVQSITRGFICQPLLTTRGYRHHAITRQSSLTTLQTTCQQTIFLDIIAYLLPLMS